LTKGRIAAGVTLPNIMPIGKTVADIWSFSRFFKMTTVRHLEFLRNRNSNCRYGLEGQCVSLCKI